METFVEDGIPLSTSSRNAEASLSQLRKVGTGHEAGSIGLDGRQYHVDNKSDRCTYQTLLDSLLDFLDLDLREAANLEQVLAVLCVYSLKHNSQSSPIE